MSDLHAYLDLERIMIFLDATGTKELADQLMDVMDALWHRLTAAEQKLLYRRKAKAAE